MITFTADVLTGLFILFILIQVFDCTDCQITIFQLCPNFLFLESRQIDFQFFSPKILGINISHFSIKS